MKNKTDFVEVDILGFDQNKIPGKFVKQTVPTVTDGCIFYKLNSKDGNEHTELEREFMDFCERLRNHITSVTGNQNVEIEDLIIKIVDKPIYKDGNR